MTDSGRSNPTTPVLVPGRKGHPVATPSPTPTPVTPRPTNTLITLPDYWGLFEPGIGGPGTYSGATVSGVGAIAVDKLLPVCYGAIRVAGTNITLQTDQGAWPIHGTGFVAWCEGVIGAIDGVYVNDIGPLDPATILANAYGAVAIFSADNKIGSEGAYPPYYPGGVALTWFNVWTTGTYPWWRFFPGWQNFPEGDTTNWTWAADVRGLQVYDPRSHTTAYSNNPALIVRDILTRFGHLTDGEIDDTSFSDAATTCDSLGFTCNIAFTQKTTVAQALPLVLQTCNGQLVISNGKRGLWLDVPNSGSPVASLDEAAGDIWGLTYEWLSARDRYTQVAVSFLNKDAKYQPDQTPFFGEAGTFSSQPIVSMASVNSTTDEITMASSPGWLTGDTVMYFQNGGAAIGGITDGVVYYIKTIAGAVISLSTATGGATVNLTGSPTITTQYLQRVGTAYPPSIPVRQMVVNSPGINTLAAAIILRDYIYNAQANSFRVSGSMRGQGISLQQGQKVHLTTLKGLSFDALIVQITGDAAGFFTFVAKPYDPDVYGSTPITQPPITPINPPNPTTPGGDITVTDASGTRQTMVSNASNSTVYHLFQLIKYTLPTTGAPISELRVRGFAGTGALSKTWEDLTGAEIMVPLTGNEQQPDASHYMLSDPNVVKTVRTLTFDTSGQLARSDDATGPTRIIIKTATPAGALSAGVTVDVAQSTNTVINPRTDIPLWKWVKSTTQADGSVKTFAVPDKWAVGTLMVVADGQTLVDNSFSPADGADYSASGQNVTIAAGRAAPSSYVAFFYQPSVEA